MTEFVSALKVKSQNKTYSKATADILHGHNLYKPESSLATWVHKSTSTHISMLCYQHLLTNHNNESNAPLLPWQMQLKVNGKPIKEYLYLGIVHKNKTKSRAKIYKSQYILRYNMPSVLWCCWLGGRKGIRPIKKQWWGAGVVICLERGADLHVAQLIPLLFTVSWFSKIQIGFTFLVPTHPGSHGKRAVKWVYVCMYILRVQHSENW